jgi:hypothetical protein
VSDQRVRRLLAFEMAGCRLVRDEIFPHRVLQCPVAKSEVAHSNGSRLDAKERPFVLAELRCGPVRRGRRVRVEVLEPDRAGGGEVVVAGDRDVLETPEERDTRAGLRPVADEVSQRPDGFDLAAASKAARLAWTSAIIRTLTR